MSLSITGSEAQIKRLHRMARGTFIGKELDNISTDISILTCVLANIDFFRRYKLPPLYPRWNLDLCEWVYWNGHHGIYAKVGKRGYQPGGSYNFIISQIFIIYDKFHLSQFLKTASIICILEIVVRLLFQGACRTEPRLNSRGELTGQMFYCQKVPVCDSIFAEDVEFLLGGFL